MRIDAHQHFWDYSRRDYGWIDASGLDALRRDFRPDDLRALLDAHGMDGSIAVQARQTAEETEWLLELARTSPWIRGVVGWADLRGPALRADIDRFRAGPGGQRLVGIRHVIQDEPAGFMDDTALRAGVAEVGRAGLVYDLLIYARQLEEADRFCAALSEQPLVLDHLGKPDIAGGGLAAWTDGIRRLAAMEHVSVKVSGLVTEADHGAWTPEQLWPYLHEVLAAFGPTRLLFGSDWPVCTLAGDYSEVLGVIVQWSAALSEDERGDLFGGNAARIYGLEVAD